MSRSAAESPRPDHSSAADCRVTGCTGRATAGLRSPHSRRTAGRQCGERLVSLAIRRRPAQPPRIRSWTVMRSRSHFLGNTVEYWELWAVQNDLPIVAIRQPPEQIVR